MRRLPWVGRGMCLTRRSWAWRDGGLGESTERVPGLLPHLQGVCSTSQLLLFPPLTQWQRKCAQESLVGISRVSKIHRTSNLAGTTPKTPQKHTNTSLPCVLRTLPARQQPRLPGRLMQNVGTETHVVSIPSQCNKNNANIF